jgi:hypothetical protein
MALDVGEHLLVALGAEDPGRAREPGGVQVAQQLVDERRVGADRAADVAADQPRPRHPPAGESLAHWRTLRDARNDRSALRAE